MKTITDVVSQGRIYGLLFLLAFLSLIIGGLSGYFVGTYLEKQDSGVAQYAKLVYNTCKAQEQVLYNANPQQKRRACEYLLEAAKEN